MLNLKNEKGSITLFVLVSCLFFIASVTCVQMYLQSKQIAVNREYRQIKANYETNLENSDVLDNTYYQLLELANLTINVESATLAGNQLQVEFTIDNTVNLNIQTIKYGWGTNSEVNTVSDWNYLETESIQNKMIAKKNNTTSSGTYHLFVMVNNKTIYKAISV